MNNIYIDTNKCTGCGLCRNVCDSTAIGIANKRATLVFPAQCSSCGHCAALCPVGAITSNTEGNYRSFTIAKYDEKLSIIEHLFLNKRSVREFKNEIPGREILTKLILFAEKAPSSTNNRHRKYIVVTEHSKIQTMEKEVTKTYSKLLYVLNPVVLYVAKFLNKGWGKKLSLLVAGIRNLKNEFVRGNSPIFKAAPCVICIAAPKKDIQAKDDCMIAQQYMMLYGESLGIGSCINGYSQYAHRTIEKILSLPKGYCIYAVGIFGHSKYIYNNEIRYDKNPDVKWYD